MAALDCPSFMPLSAEALVPQLLGTIAARQDRPVPLRSDHVLLAWVLERDGRRSTTESGACGAGRRGRRTRPGDLVPRR